MPATADRVHGAVPTSPCGLSFAPSVPPWVSNPATGVAMPDARVSGAARLADCLGALAWVPHHGRTYSRTLLMKEHLRRAAVWAGLLQHTGRWPFFDIAAAADPAVRADPALVADVQRRLDAVPVSGPALRSCVWALHWAELATVRPDAVAAGPDPYEPLLVMFERGGDFTLSTGSIDVDIAGVPPRTAEEYRGREPLASLDTAYLDEADARRANRRGPTATMPDPAGAAGRFVIMLRGRLDADRLAAVRSALRLSARGRLSDREDAKFGSRAFRGDAALGLWRYGDDRWGVTVTYRPDDGVTPADLDELAGEVAAVAADVGLTVEERRSSLPRGFASTEPA